MERLRAFMDRVRFSRQEMTAVLAVFGLYAVGLTWKHVQSHSSQYDESYYTRLDSLIGSDSFVVIADTVPKRRDSLAFDSAAADPRVDTGPSVDGGRLNINEATERQFTLLPGIGPSLASRIIAYRQEHGDFSSVDDLEEVKGIGPKKVDRFRNLIVVE